MIYFIDTNIFLRVLVKESEETFKVCEQVLGLIRQDKIQVFTSTIVLSEIDWVLEIFYKFPKEKVIEGLSSILRLKNLKIIDKFDLFLAIEIYEKFPVKFIDALIASNPQIFQKKVIVVSYDRDFDKIGIKRKEPKKIIN
jgi:predicted nucleic-acid-binding protein